MNPDDKVEKEMIFCSRCHELKSRLAKPPFKGPLGQKIYEKVSASAWQEWLKAGTILINELRLDLSNPRHSEIYDQHMSEFLNLDKE